MSDSNQVHPPQIGDQDHSDKDDIVLIRPFKTHDFMTGVAAIPGKDLPLEVVSKMVSSVLFWFYSISLTLFS
jgi:GMP synthase (glutamine-hydrolysing)